MTTPAITGGKTSALLRFLQQELRGFPGRYNAMLRYLLSSVIVIITSLTLGVPQLAYSLLVVFFCHPEKYCINPDDISAVPAGEYRGSRGGDPYPEIHH